MGGDSIDDLLRRVAATDEPPAVVRVPSHAGRYRVDAPLGRGGLGLVHAGFDPELRRDLAIKFVRPEQTGGALGATRQARLRREAQALARVDHPHVVKVFDVGDVGDQVYIAMERVDGRTLATWLRERPRTREEIVAAFLRAGEGLAAAHAEGVVHRDFKPDNVLVEAGGRVVVVDFGLAHELQEDDTSAPATDAERVPASSDERLTATGAFVGTVGYAAPEQRDGAPTTPLVDQYGFCVSLAEALVGGPPASVLVRLPALEDPLRSVITRGLSDDPSDRWPTMTALLAALAAARAPRRRWPWAAVAAIAVLAVAAWAIVARDRDDDHDAEDVAVADTVTRVAAMAHARGDLDRGLAASAHQHEALARDGFASAFFSAQTADGHEVAFEAAIAMAMLEQESGRLGEAREWLAHAQTLVDRLERPSLRARVLFVAGLLEADVAAGRRDIETALDLLESDPEGDASEIGALYVAAGTFAADAGDVALGVRRLERAIEICRDVWVPCHASALGELGRISRQSGHGERARSVLHEAVALRVGFAGADDLDAATYRLNLGVALAEADRHAEARVELDEAVRVFELPANGEHPDAALAYEASGLAYEAAGDTAAAELAYQRALATREATVGRDHVLTSETLMRLASTAYGRKDYAAARGYAVEAREIATRVLGADAWFVGSTYGMTAEIHAQLGERDDAIADATRAVELLAATDMIPDELAYAKFLLAQLLWDDVARRSEGLALAREAEAWYAAGNAGFPGQAEAVHAWLADKP